MTKETTQPEAAPTETAAVSTAAVQAKFTAGPSTTKVRLDRPGVRAVGDYLAGVVYEIDDPQEAERLIHVKRFTRVLE
jgi:hypothetical protein